MEKTEVSQEQKLAEAKALVAKEAARNTQAAAEKIQAILAEHKVKFDVQIHLNVASDKTIKTDWTLNIVDAQS